MHVACVVCAVSVSDKLTTFTYVNREQWTLSNGRNRNFSHGKNAERNQTRNSLEIDRFDRKWSIEWIMWRTARNGKLKTHWSNRKFVSFFPSLLALRVDRKLSLDLVPRIGPLAVDPHKISLASLHQVHVNSSENAKASSVSTTRTLDFGRW